MPQAGYAPVRPWSRIGRKHHSPCTARGLPALARYRACPSVALRHRTAFHVLAVALYGLCGTFRTRRLWIGNQAADVICRAFQEVSGLSSPELPRAYASPFPKGPAHCTAMERNRKWGCFKKTRIAESTQALNFLKRRITLFKFI